MRIPLLKQLNRNEWCRELISVHDLLFVQMEGRRIKFTTPLGEYSIQGKFDEWKIILTDCSLYEVDRGVLACMDKVYMVDPKLRLIYFHKKLGGKCCTVSNKQLSRIQSKFPHIEWKFGSSQVNY